MTAVGTEELRDRYLALLKDSLLGRPHLENEVRIEYLLSLPPGAEPSPDSLRDPARTLEVRYKRLAQSRESGGNLSDGHADGPAPYANEGRAGLDHLQAALEDLERRGVAGDLACCGVGRGGAAIMLKGVMAADGVDDRTLWLIDTFAASAPAEAGEDRPARSRLNADLNQVRDGFDRFGLFDDRIRFAQGAYDATLAGTDTGPLALLCIGGDAATRVGAVLNQLLPRVVPGGIVIVEGIGRPNVETRLLDHRERRGITEPLHRVSWNIVSWQVARAAEAPEPAPASVHRAPLIPPVEGDELDLSVVITFYNMQREAARTLHSLSRAYQRDIDDLRYEVLVVDNGSDPDQRLTPEQVASYGPEFRLLSHPEAPSSPTITFNEAIAQTRGRAVAMMIDGAHVLTPGVLHHAARALTTYEPAMVVIQQWYVGPGQQGDAQQAGYDQQAEDKLFRNIRWPTDGYRLFEIGHFIGDRDWFDGLVESNCLIAPRSVLEQVGGFEDSFDMAGGGYVNLEAFERVHAHPGINVVTILGEGSFHQFHGGTTTNVADEAVRRQRIFGYGDHYRTLKGRPLTGINKPIHYMGSMSTKAARRTRSRREYLLSFQTERDPVDTTETAPQTVPEELKFAAIEAVWASQSWREATWLGHPVARYPADLHSYQELIAKVAPDVVLLVSNDGGVGGRALFVASIQELLGHGRVVVATTRPAAELPTHHRITVLPADEPAAVQAEVGDASALVLIGLGPTDRVLAAFDAYADLVPVGSYVVIENTVVNGRPSEPAFGPGPHEAVAMLLQRTPHFVPDVAYERYTVTFNKHGYLRRMTSP